MKVARQTILHDRHHASRLVLPCARSEHSSLSPGWAAFAGCRVRQAAACASTAGGSSVRLHPSCAFIEVRGAGVSPSREGPERMTLCGEDLPARPGPTRGMERPRDGS